MELYTLSKNTLEQLSPEELGEITIAKESIEDILHYEFSPSDREKVTRMYSPTLPEDVLKREVNKTLFMILAGQLVADEFIEQQDNYLLLEKNLSHLPQIAQMILPLYNLIEEKAPYLLPQ